MSVTLRKVTEGDLEQIMRWRMDPEITRYMNTDPKLTLEGQKKWFAKVQQDPDVSYWIIEINGTAAGVINYTGLTNPTGDLGWALLSKNVTLATRPIVTIAPTFPRRALSSRQRVLMCSRTAGSLLASALS